MAVRDYCLLWGCPGLVILTISLFVSLKVGEADATESVRPHHPGQPREDGTPHHRLQHTLQELRDGPTTRHGRSGHHRTQTRRQCVLACQGYAAASTGETFGLQQILHGDGDDEQRHQAEPLQGQNDSHQKTHGSGWGRGMHTESRCTERE